MPQILFKKLLPHAQIPTQGSEHAAGFDLYAAGVMMDVTHNQLIVDTGLTIAFDTGYVLMLHGRSGLASKFGIRLSNGTGIIDADYRGPLKVLLRSDLLSLEELARQITIGDRVAQAILLPIPQVTWVEATQLSETARGEGGFGSTGTR